MRARAEALRALDPEGVRDALRRVSETYGLVPRSDWTEIAERELAGDGGDAVARARRLVGHLTIGETYLLRHRTHFERVAERAAAARGEGRVFRVWSAGCSSGEEAWSVVASVAHALGPAAVAGVAVLATDVNPTAVERARAGVYGPWSFRECPPWVHAWFEERPDGRHVVRDDLRAAVTFEVRGLTERARALPAACLDVVLFRNVAIYLDAETTRVLFAEMHRVLRADGLLIVAPSDPRPVDGFEVTPDPSTSVLQRTRIADERGARPDRRPGPPARPDPRPAGPGRPPGGAAAPVAAPAAVDAGALADVGALEAALARAPEGPDGAVLRAQIHLAEDRVAEAVAELRRATFLAPGHRIARFWYAVALEAGGERALAGRQVGTLIRALGTGSPVLEDGATPAADLLGAARRLQQRLADRAPGGSP